MTERRADGGGTQLSLIPSETAATAAGRDATAVARVFDPARLTQARRLTGGTKRDLAESLGVSAAAVTQWESGAATPRPDHLVRLAEVLGVEVGFFAAGRPYARLDAAHAHFRCLRSTPATLRAKATAFTEQVWELTQALERRVQLPHVDLPGYEGGEGGTVHHDAVQAAHAIRARWALGEGPVPHLVRTIERHGVVVALAPFAGEATAKVDAFSTSHLPRPLIVLTPDRAQDVYRHRFTAAHELGHLVLHHDAAGGGDASLERQADAFAAELLTPRASITPRLPSRMDLNALDQLRREWGVSVHSLLYRCREVEAISETTYRRAFQRLAQLRKLGLEPVDPITAFPGEIPSLLPRAFDLAAQNGLTHHALAAELHITLPRLRLLLGQGDTRPTLRLA